MSKGLSINLAGDLPLMRYRLGGHFCFDDLHYSRLSQVLYLTLHQHVKNYFPNLLLTYRRDSHMPV